MCLRTTPDGVMCLHIRSRDQKSLTPGHRRVPARGWRRRNGKCCLAQAGWIFLDFCHPALDLEVFTPHFAITIATWGLQKSFCHICKMGPVSSNDWARWLSLVRVSLCHAHHVVHLKYTQYFLVAYVRKNKVRNTHRKKSSTQKDIL